MTSADYKSSRDNSRYFKQALFADTLRGVDSTGIAVMDMTKMDQPLTFKKSLAAPDFLQLKKAGTLLDDNNQWDFILGHNRAATKGGITDATSHPFQIGDITMVHNGTIVNHRQLVGGSKFDVDSEAITNAVDVDGIRKVVSDINGAFALVWHDAEDNTVNFIRNKERPLYLGISKDKETVLFASEGNMLQWIALRNGIDIETIFQPTAGEHLKYFIGDKDWADKPLMTVLPLYQAPTYPKSWAGNTSKKPGGGKNSSTPNTRTTLTENVLKELGLPIDEPVIAEVVGFTKYNNNDPKMTGVMTCKIPSVTKVHDVLVYQVSQAEFTKLKGSKIVSEVTQADRRNARNTVILNSVEFKVYEEPLAIEKKDDEPTVEEIYVGPKKAIISEGAMLTLLDNGCDNCSSDIDITEADDIGWNSDDKPVCPYCLIQFGTHLH